MVKGYVILVKLCSKNKVKKEENKEIETTVANSTKSDANVEVKNNVKKKSLSDYEYDSNREFKDKVSKVKRISKTVKGGRRIYFNFLVIVGNLKGNYDFVLKKVLKSLLIQKKH